jgi:5'-phosphate synthase pdxT subunit
VASCVGLLALQGDFAKHGEAIVACGHDVREVRRPRELAECSHLVLPGGESTTLARLIDRAGLREPLREFAGARPVLATCAGLILLARRLDTGGNGAHGVEPLGLLDVTVARNAYGRQVDSFTEEIATPHFGEPGLFRAVYIRAPRITAVGDGVTVLARRAGDRGAADGAGEPVAVRQGNLFGLTFHPELTADLRFHRAFLRAEAAD